MWPDLTGKRDPDVHRGSMIHRSILTSLALAGLMQPAAAMDLKARLDLEPLIVQHAKANNVPPSLVHRIIIRESRYNARAVGRGGALGLMQIKHATARALGYSGPADGLLDADTNLTYGVRYLAGAYRVAGGDQNQAVGYFARGYYYDAKRKGMSGALAPIAVAEPVAVAAAPQPQQPQSIFSLLFSPQPQPAPQATQAAVVEPETPATPPRSKRQNRQGAVAAATVQKASVPSEPAQNVQAPGAASEPRRNRSGSMAPPVGGVTRSEAAQASGGTEAPPVPMRSGRPARPTAASDGDRSAQTVSAQPGDPGRRP
jgi:Transglycosylase SLT domain